VSDLQLAAQAGRPETEGSVAPDYDAKVARTAEILTQAFKRRSAPTKLTWLLNHHYSPAGLSFSQLKGEDAARVQVLRQATQRAGCALHLAVVHIEESGPAELHDSYYDRYSHSRYYDDDVDDDEDSDRVTAIPATANTTIEGTSRGVGAANPTFAASASPRSGFTLPGKENPPRDRGNARTKVDLPYIGRKIRLQRNGCHRKSDLRRTVSGFGHDIPRSPTGDQATKRAIHFGQTTLGVALTMPRTQGKT
jgi:hypothetical protein